MALRLRVKVVDRTDAIVTDQTHTIPEPFQPGDALYIEAQLPATANAAAYNPLRISIEPLSNPEPVRKKRKLVTIAYAGDRRGRYICDSVSTDGAILTMENAEQLPPKDKGVSLPLLGLVLHAGDAFMVTEAL